MFLIDPLFEAFKNSDDIGLIVFIAAIFALGGFTKGAIGFGLPTVAIPLLANFIPLPVAVSISLLPIVLSNAYQAVSVGSLSQSLKRFWPLLISICVTLSISTQLLVKLPASSLLAAMGAITILLAGLQLSRYRLSVPTHHEKWTGVGIGILGGFMGGLTSLFSMPLIIFLTSLRLSKDEFVNAISLVLFSGSLVIALVLARYSVLTKAELIISLYIMIPLTLSYMLGTRLRNALNPDAFLRVILIFLLLNGAWLIYSGLNA